MNVLSRVILQVLSVVLLVFLQGCPPPEPVASKCDCLGADGEGCPFDLKADGSGADLGEIDAAVPSDQVDTGKDDTTEVGDSAGDDGGDKDQLDLAGDLGPTCDGTPDCFEKGICSGKVLSWCDGTEWRCSYDLVQGLEWGGELTCDGLDNDCDGAVDEALIPPPDTCLFQGACAEAVPVCTNGNWDCGYGALAQYQQEPELSCDGIDNDCDGTPDEELCQEGTPGDTECIDNDSYHVLQGDGNSWGAPKACKPTESCMGLGECTRKDIWQINTFATDGQAKPSAARLGDGFSVTWQSEGLDTSSYGIAYRTFGGTGNELLPEQKLNLFTKGAQQHPAAVAMGADAFFAGWESADQDGSGVGLFGRIILEGGSAGSELVLPATTTLDQKDLAFAPLGEAGDVIAVWADNSQGNFRLKGGHIANAGWPWTLEVEITTQSKDDDTRPAVAVVGTDAAVVVWERKVGPLPDLFARRASNVAGLEWSLASEIPVATGVMEVETKPTISASGAYVYIAWLEEQAKRICVRRFKPDLSSAGDAVCMNAESGGVQAVALAVLGDDEVAVAWQEGPSQNNKIKLAPFAGGTTFGASYLVDVGAMDPDGSLSLVAFAGGKVLVTWARSGIASGLDIWAKFVQM